MEVNKLVAHGKFSCRIEDGTLVCSAPKLDEKIKKLEAVLQMMRSRKDYWEVKQDKGQTAYVDGYISALEFALEAINE